MEKANSKFRTPPHIRAALMLRGMTLLDFARAYGYAQSTVYAAARGERLGVVGTKVRTQLLKEAAL